MRKIKSKVSFLGILLLLVSLGMMFVASTGQSAEELYEAAVFKKDAGGDMEEAIRLFRQIVERFSGQAEIAGKAQLQIGLCYEKLGKAEAVKAYELVLKNYAGQAELVAAARERLVALQVEVPPGLTVKKLPKSLEEPNYSKDGTKAVFNTWSIPGQNIGVYDFTTEKMTPITRFDWQSKGHGITYWPVFSPDAKEVAYWFWYHNGPKKSELRISTLDGRSRTVFQGDDTIVPCDWLPDGSAVLAFSRLENKSWRLGLVPSKGGEFKVLRDVGMYRTSAAVSPDGRFIIYVTGPQGKHDIQVMTVDGKDVGTLTSHPANDEKALWSPDGKYVVFKSDRSGGMGLWGVAVKDGKAEGPPFLIKPDMENSDLINWTDQGLACKSIVISYDVYVMPVDPETAKPLGEARLVDYTPTGSNMTPAWSPDGKYLAFLSVRDRAYIVVMPAAGGEAKEYLAPFDNFWGRTTWRLMNLRWLPDSSGVGFRTLYAIPGDAQPSLFCLDIASGEWKSWPVRTSWNGTWGRDGTTYIFEREEEGVRKGLVERDLETGEEHFIYSYPYTRQGGNIRAMVPSKDFKKVIFRKGGIGWTVLNLDTGEDRLLEGIRLGVAIFAPDGKRILGFIPMDKDPKFRMFLLSEEGVPGEDIELGGNFPKDRQPRLPDWSPDGKQLAFQGRTWFEEDFFLQNLFVKK